MLLINLQWNILFLLSIFSAVFCDWTPPTPENHQVCNSKTCKERGSDYLNNMVRSVNPCEDFYSFTCGAWEKNHPSPPYSDWSVAHQMTENTLHILRRLLEQLPVQQTDDQMTKLKLVYHTCLQIPYFDKHEPKEIGAQIIKIGRYPAKKLWDLHNEYLKVAGESALFDIDVGGFDEDINLPMLLFSEPQSVFGSIYHEIKWEHSEELSYVEALFHMMSSLGLPDSPDVLKKRIANACKFRSKLNTIIAKTSEFDPDEVPMQMKPSRLETEYKRFVATPFRNKYTIAIPWEQTVKILLHKMSPAVVTTKNIALFHRSEYFKMLANLLAASSEQEIADHMEIYFVERHLKRTPKVKELLQNSWKNPPPTKKSLRYDEPRWMTCIKECDMTSALAKLFISKWYKVEHKEQVQNILAEIKAAVKHQVSGSKWLDDESKTLTYKRLDEIEDLIGEPTRRRQNYSPVRSIFPSAFLDMENDVMFVNAAMLQSPVFDPTLPTLYNLGTTAFLLGHEFYHVIDDCGTRRLTTTRKVHLWSEKMRNTCSTRKKCFIDHYNKVTQLEFQRRYKLSPKVDTSESFLENYPDVMGLEAAYMYHSKILKRDKGKCEVLPGFAGYNCDQMFFITLANMFCGNPPARKAVASLTDDLHSINSVRINGALSSTKAFAKAFECRTLDTMNPATKCNLWE